MATTILNLLSENVTQEHIKCAQFACTGLDSPDCQILQDSSYSTYRAYSYCFNAHMNL